MNAILTISQALVKGVAWKCLIRRMHCGTSSGLRNPTSGVETTTTERGIAMTFEVNCYWADNCADAEITVTVSSIDELLTKVEAFFERSCGLSGVEDFCIECTDNEFNIDIDPYEWSNENLRRNRNLSDVWRKVRKDISEYFGKALEK